MTRRDLPLLLASGLLLLGGSVHAVQDGLDAGAVALLVLGSTCLGGWIYSQGRDDDG